MYKNRGMLNKFSWLILVVLSFTVVYASSLEFVYVEGDDATSIAYHLLGRNPDIQPPYSAYQGMADRLLGLLPNNEIQLRYFAIGLTSVATIIAIILMIEIVFSWFKHEEKFGKFFSTGMILLSAPELFYFGLVYSPTMLALCFIFGSHLLLRLIYKENKLRVTQTIVIVLISSLIFGLGISFRWNTVVYGLVIFVDAILLTHDYGVGLKWERYRVLLPFVWALFAIISAVLMVGVSGYKLSAVMSQISAAPLLLTQQGTLSQSIAYYSREMIIRMFLVSASLFTPIFTLLILVGFVGLVRSRNPFYVVVLVGALGVLPWVRSGTPKFMATAIPIMITCFLYGLQYIFQKINIEKQQIKAVLLIAVIIPWIIGIQTSRDNSAWGPGFELRSYDDLSGVSKVRLKFSSGTAIPTFEGPRPIYGHAYVLLGGGWSDFVLQKQYERRQSIETAIKMNIPLVVTSWSPDYFVNDLYFLNYQTSDSSGAFYGASLFANREFTSTSDGSFMFLSREIFEDDVPSLVSELVALQPEITKVILVGYPSVMRSLYENYPDAMKKIGTTEAVIELSLLSSQ